MIIPSYWAEWRVRDHVQGHQVTVRRFGWSDTSQEDAQQNAQTRAKEALARIVSGEKVPKREPKRPYNGAKGVPIREEVVGRHGDVVITRNGYGARCLNTPDVLFVDVDFQSAPRIRVVFWTGVILAVAAFFLGWRWRSLGTGLAVAIPAALFLTQLIATAMFRLGQHLSGGEEKRARGRIDVFSAGHPDWHIRIYRTPAGFRLLVMHRTFDPAEDEVAHCFHALNADPVYVRMCRNQQCFRARVSPKPWRIGIGDHIKPRPGTWPVNPLRMPERRIWIDAYEAAARSYASCRFVEAVGSKAIDSQAASVQCLHDDLCQATSGLPIA